jgi:hypothetical protein
MEAHKDITGSFGGGRSPRAAPREGYRMLGRKSFWFAKERFSYYPNVSFADDYRYSWEKEEKAQVPSSNFFEAGPVEQDSESEVLEW